MFECHENWGSGKKILLKMNLLLGNSFSVSLEAQHFI